MLDGIYYLNDFRRGLLDKHLYTHYAAWGNTAATPWKPPGSPSKLDHSAMRLLEADIKSRPWATHKQRSEFLFAACGVEVSETTICRAIKKRLSHSRKKDRQEPVIETNG